MFWQNFTRLCTEAGKPPSRVVEEIGLKKAAVTSWKKGVNPRDSTLDRIAYYFGVPVETLTAETTPDLPQSPQSPLEPDEAQLIADYRAFSYAGRGLIRDFIERMKAEGIYAKGVDPLLMGFNSDWAQAQGQ